jgi:hypothetical protein
MAWVRHQGAGDGLQCRQRAAVTIGYLSKATNIEIETVRYCERIRLLPMIRFDSYGTCMAKPYRSRIDSRNHLREVNAARCNQSERNGVAKVLANAKDTAKAMLGF